MYLIFLLVTSLELELEHSPENTHSNIVTLKDVSTLEILREYWVLRNLRLYHLYQSLVSGTYGLSFREQMLYMY